MGSVQLRPHAKLCVSGILSKCFVYAVPLPWLSICFPLNLFIVLPEFGKFCRILHACGKELEHYRQNLSSSLAKSKSRAAKRRKKLRAVGIRKKECRKTLATARPSIELFPDVFSKFFFWLHKSAQRCLQQGAGRQDQNLLRAIQGMPLQALVVRSLPLL